MGRPRAGKSQICPVCGNSFYRSPSRKRKTCSLACRGVQFKGADNPNWRGLGSRRAHDQKYYYSKKKPRPSKAVRKRSYELLKEKYPEKLRAMRTISDALRRGKLTRPNQCSRCGKEGRIEGHHPDYSKPLEVIWLCTLCHNDVHLELKG